MKPRKPLKRGQPPRRKKPLKRGKAPKRSPLVRKVVQKIKSRGRSRFPKRRDVGYKEWIASLPCLLIGKRQITVVSTLTWDIIRVSPNLHIGHFCGGDVEATHVKSRGAAGMDYGNLVPLCHEAHQDQQHFGIKSWAAQYWPDGVDELRRIAAEVYPAQFLKAKELGWGPDAVGF